MRLIGMLDSPYVRRVAVALHLLEMRFVHESLSVFRDFDAFAGANPVVKAPTLVTEDGTVLMDSTLILQHLDRHAAPALRLAPAGEAEHARALRVSGLALAACEKTVQIVYEFALRPAEKRHAPWLDRVGGQLRQAYGLLEAEMPEGAAWLLGDRPLQADVDAAVAWAFTRHVLSDLAPDTIPPAADHPRLVSFGTRAEGRPAFRAAPMV